MNRPTEEIVKYKTVFILFLVVASSTFLFSSKYYTQRVYCNLLEPFGQRRTGLTRLYTCSNIRQKIVKMENIEENISDVNQELAILSPKDGNLPATIELDIIKDRNEAIIFPRIFGRDSKITVLEKDYGRVLFHMEGRPIVWSEIGWQGEICLYCLDSGFDKEYYAHLTFVLNGKWAQLWVQDGHIVF